MMERREFLGHMARATVAGGAVLAMGRRAWPLVGVLGAQLVLGLVNLLLLAPVWAQILHLLLADVLWISLVFVCAGMLEDQAPAKALAVTSR